MLVFNFQLKLRIAIGLTVFSFWNKMMSALIFSSFVPLNFRKKKDKKFSDTAMALANTRIWEARLDATEKSRQEFRENAKHLSLENEALQRQMLQSEKDTIDVITYLKKEDQTKDEQIFKLQLVSQYFLILLLYFIIIIIIIINHIIITNTIVF